MEITATKQNINEINKILPDLTRWLVDHTVHSGSAAICLQAIITELDKISEAFKEEN